ncbi:hypothetical protein DAEQUDRAFT_723488 [Daedalea quercina L-15889]|uniref:Uncharacterized protein n=1 Tax=Daedalea quercina L-15889 TaxID=1314783 RepID=A0A165SEQ7_9APHY|nr:hypothetical protein DAEQUDRAFT_723488 [Daedalea quercina L-15889]
MRSSAVVAVVLVAAVAPAIALPINEFGIAARASQYRRSPDLVESIYARDEDETMLYRRQPNTLNRLRIGVPVNRNARRSPEPFVIFSKDAANIPACHSGFAFCGRSIEDGLD